MTKAPTKATKRTNQTKKASPAPTPYVANPFLFSWRAMTDAWRVNQQSYTILILLQLATVIFISSISNPEPNTLTLNTALLQLGQVGLSLFLTVAGIVIAIESHKKKQMSFAMVWKRALEFFVPCILISIVSTLLIMLGLLLFIIPGVILAIRFGLVYYVRLNEKQKFGDIFRRSLRLTKGRFIEFTAVQIVAALYSIGGLLTPFNVPAITNTWYEQVKAYQDGNHKLPQTHWASWLTVLVVAFLAALMAVFLLVAIRAQTL